MEWQPKIEVRSVGDKGQTVVVIDGFARDPERWREAAMAADYRTMGDYYPGRRAHAPKAYFDDVGPLLGAIFRKAFGCSAHMSVDRALYSIVSTPPVQLNLAQRVPHIDNSEPDRFAMVHYLSHQDLGGTGFYRHKASGFETVTPDRHRLYLDQLEQDFARTGEPEPGYIEGDTDLFVQTGAVDHAYNRAVLYPGNLLHCSLTRNDCDYPDDPRLGRLTIAAFMLAR
ncbi:DUF6445 family protein [Sphingorhabdus sp.]|jgi:hypothetical protein|uniref:DUF6445 family protein n=1 Tax=Sphingorhabdus sp. TaxID=1902408 RepID=UPI003BAF725E|nr:hypothetical protein [Sphingomonadales bacterium]MBL0023254.1 hypothetical protein [Sphingomonadales bacterium]